MTVFVSFSVFVTEPRQPDSDYGRALVVADLVEAALDRWADLGRVADILAISAAGFGFLGEVDRRIEITAGIVGFLGERIGVFVGDRQRAGAVAAVHIDDRHER